MKKYLPVFIFLIIILAGCSQNKLQAAKKSNETEFSASSYDFRELIAWKYFTLADASLLNGDVKSAIKLLQKAIEKDPSSIYLKEKIIELLFMNAIFDDQKLKELVNIGETYFQKGTRSHKIFYFMALSYEKLGEPAKADKFFQLALQEKKTAKTCIFYYEFKNENQGIRDTTLLETALQLPWNNHQDILRIAELYGSFNQNRELEILEKALGKWNKEEVLKPLLRVYESQQDYIKIIEQIETSLEKGLDISEPLKTYFISRLYAQSNHKKIIEYKDLCLDVNNQDILLYLMLSAMNLQDFDLATTAAQNLLKIPELTEELEDKINVNLIYFNIVQDDTSSALRNLQIYDDPRRLESLFSDFSPPDSSAYQAKLLNTLMQLGKSKPALADYLLLIYYWSNSNNKQTEEYLEKIPADFIEAHDLYFQLAMVELDINEDITEATKLLNQLEDLEEPVEEVIVEILYRLEKDSLALQQVDNMLELGKKPSARLFLILSTYDENYLPQEKYLQLMNKAVELYPENADILNSLGYFLVDNNIEHKFSLAEDLLSKAVRLKPESAMIWDSYAWLHFRKGNYHKALDAMQVPLKKAITHAEIAYHLAEIYLKLQDKDKAIQFFQLAVELGDDREATKISKQKLDELQK